MEAEWGPQGPIRPPAAHPEWQGSIPAHYVDRESGCNRGKKVVDHHAKEGVWGIARQGLGGYMTDVQGKLEQEFSQVKRSHPMARYQSQEFIWRPSRRCCAGPNVNEPDKISSRPPFVQRHGSFVVSHAAQSLPPIYDQQVDRYLEGAMVREKKRQVAKERKEMHEAKRMVQGLDDWEGELPQRCGKNTASPATGRLAKSASSSVMDNASPSFSQYSMGMPAGMHRSASDSRMGVSRHR
eukprot:TRINITY_DN31669_c0_g1_i1.p1 TRINITY_DN31669_c0_g1~~TRINITY_DN31669_c0_g1_i1.p1  ORF type:complete len:239 (+),score=41.03 TRINITY_DN31669_c0_g1_i1:57-773(+)